MNKDHLSPTIEDYLSAIYIHERDGEVIIGARLAELFNVSAPTVTNTLKRMVRDGWIAPHAQKNFCLTADGLRLAESVMRRHMLTEWMLSPMIAWSKVHDEAHNLEHSISDEVEQALQRILKDPSVCPHGNPLPGNEELVARWIPLPNIPAGSAIIIRRIHELAEETPHLLEFLEKKGVMPGRSARVAEIEAINNTILLKMDEGSAELSLPVAKFIYVEPASPGAA